MVEHPLEIVRGDTEVFELAFTDEDDVIIDITGWTVYMTVKVSLFEADDTDAVISKTVTSHTSPTLGQTEITFTSTETDNLTPGTLYYYDIQIKTDDDMIKTIMKGQLNVLYDVTRRTS